MKKTVIGLLGVVMLSLGLINVVASPASAAVSGCRVYNDRSYYDTVNKYYVDNYKASANCSQGTGYFRILLWCTKGSSSVPIAGPWVYRSASNPSVYAVADCTTLYNNKEWRANGSALQYK